MILIYFFGMIIDYRLFELLLGFVIYYRLFELLLFIYLFIIYYLFLNE